VRRVAVEVARERAEEARARLLELAPEGFEEVERADVLELAAYTDAAGEERIRDAFGTARATGVESGWEDRWRSFHRPVRVRRLWVGPPWAPIPPDLVAVVIEPGRAFGTGAHATTRLCLQLLQELDPASLLDIGCGSGVLAVAAARLGWAPVRAVDVDEAAVEATAANARANGVDVDVRLVRAGDALPRAAVAIANISHAAVRGVAASVDAGVLVASGYLARDAAGLAGWRHCARRLLEGWAADLYRRQ
jgi:ribosomal protein L11 methyltransferase